MSSERKIKVEATIVLLCAIVFIVAAASVPGCVSIAPGHDAVVVRAEQVTVTSLEVFDAFLRWEYANRAELAKTAPEVRKLADRVREQGLEAVGGLHRAVGAYKAGKSPDGKVVVDTWLGFVRKLVEEASAAMAKEVAIGNAKEPTQKVE